MVNDREMNDIENAILRKIIPKTAIVVKVGYSGDGRNTFCSVNWIDREGKIHTKHGISKKRKGDKYNKRLGQIIALIKMIK